MFVVLRQILLAMLAQKSRIDLRTIKRLFPLCTLTLLCPTNNLCPLDSCQSSPWMQLGHVEGLPCLPVSQPLSVNLWMSNGQKLKTLPTDFLKFYGDILLLLKSYDLKFHLIDEGVKQPIIAFWRCTKVPKKFMIGTFWYLMELNALKIPNFANVPPPFSTHSFLPAVGWPMIKNSWQMKNHHKLLLTITNLLHATWWIWNSAITWIRTLLNKVVQYSDKPLATP